MSESAPPPVAETPDVPQEPFKKPDPKAPDYLKMFPQEIQDIINKIKERGIPVYMTFLSDKFYLFRTMNVIEWMKLQETQEQRQKAQGATDEYLQQALFEDIVVRTSLGVITTDDDGIEHLNKPIDVSTIKGQPAGVPSSLAQQVMYQSGFDSNPMTVKL